MKKLFIISNSIAKIISKTSKGAGFGAYFFKKNTKPLPNARQGFCVLKQKALLNLTLQGSCLAVVEYAANRIVGRAESDLWQLLERAEKRFEFEAHVKVFGQHSPKCKGFGDRRLAVKEAN